MSEVKNIDWRVPQLDRNPGAATANCVKLGNENDMVCQKVSTMSGTQESTEGGAVDAVWGC